MIGMRLLALVPLAALTAAAGPQDLQTRLRAIVAAPSGVPGCAVAVTRDGKVLAALASGAADIDKGLPNTPDTQFYAASVSKQFTAMAVVQLVAAGKIGLDENVRRYLPELPDYGRPITVRMLLHHMAGIVDDVNLAILEGQLNPDAARRADSLAMLFRQKATRFTPGTRFEYSNGGYLLLSEIVERVSKEPFEDYVAGHILKPLGMTRSFMMRDVRGPYLDRARGYRMRDGQAGLSDRYPSIGGSGGLITTVNDLAKWDHDIDSAHIIWSPTVTRLMLDEGRFANGAPVMRRGHSFSYGAGLAIGPHWIQHTGSANGFATIYARHPASRTGIILLCNDGGIDIMAKAEAVSALLDPKLPPIDEPEINPHPLDGTYRNENIAAAWDVATAGDTLTLTIRPPAPGAAPAQLTLTRTPEGDYRYTGLLLSPDDDSDGFSVSFGLVSYHFTRSGRGAGHGGVG